MISSTTCGAKPREGSSSIRSRGAAIRAACDGEHLSLSPAQRAGQLIAALLQDRKQLINGAAGVLGRQEFRSPVGLEQGDNAGRAALARNARPRGCRSRPRRRREHGPPAPG